MSSKAQTAPSRELLLANHTFPCAYMIKAFGPNDAVFKVGVLACASAVLPESQFESHERVTKNGRQVCVTLTLSARSVEDIEAVYAGIYTITTLKFIL